MGKVVCRGGKALTAIEVTSLSPISDRNLNLFLKLLIELN